jgi:hypothetical protein
VRANAAVSRAGYQRRLAQLEASADRLSRLLMSADAETAPRLLRRLENIDLELELLREALGYRDDAGGPCGGSDEG